MGHTLANRGCALANRDCAHAELRPPPCGRGIISGLMAESDEKIYDRFLLSGSSDDLAALLERHGPALTLFLFGYIHDMDKAEDLMMDAFAVVASRERPFFAMSSFKTWLFSIGKKLAFQEIRKKRIQEEALDDKIREALTPELSMLREERKLLLYRALAQLSTDYRQALYLLYFEEMSHEEAGRVMKKTRRQMYNLVERGKKALKETLERMGYDHAEY